MTTASQTVIARIEEHRTERRGFTMMVVGALVLLLSLAASHLWPPRALTDSTHEIR